MMTSTNILIASFYSFLIHAGLFLGFFGYFENTVKPNKILSSPLSVKMLIEDIAPNTQKKKYIKMQPDIYVEPEVESAEIIQKIMKTKSFEVFESGIDSLLSEEKASDDTFDEEIVRFYNEIKLKIESAWIKPRNIPSNLSCDLKIVINPQETFSFFKEMKRKVYEDSFKNVIFRFNPTE